MELEIIKKDKRFSSADLYYKDGKCNRCYTEFRTYGTFAEIYHRARSTCKQCDGGYVYWEKNSHKVLRFFKRREKLKQKEKINYDNQNYITFETGEQMLKAIRSGSDLWSPSINKYVFLYNDRGAICFYNIDQKQAKKLRELAKQNDEYWGAFLGAGGRIYDEYSDALEYCNSIYNESWEMV